MGNQKKAVVFTKCDAKDDIFVNGPEARSEAGRWEKLLDEYAACDNLRVLFIFLTDGYKGVLAAKDPWTSLRKEHLLREKLQEFIGKTTAPRKFKLVGVQELQPTMSALERICQARGESLSGLLLADQQHMYYDSPKLVEAIIRIARGTKYSDELLFRLDEDVSPKADGLKADGLKELIEYNDHTWPTEAYQGYDFYSGGYFVHPPSEYDLLNDYAIRCTLFAPIDSKRFSPLDKGYDAAKKWIDSLKHIGADPNHQCVSGAGLYISPKAIEMFPPFTNTSHRIVWIDDHLKRVLHEAVGHLPKPDAGFDIRRVCSKANFPQDRYPKGVKTENIHWGTWDYLPRLVMGCLLDAAMWTPYHEYVMAARNESFVIREENLRQQIFADVNRRYARILDIWGDPEYDSYPIRRFVEAELRPPGRFEKYLSDVVQDLHLYLKLTSTWGTTVDIVRHLTDKNDQCLFYLP